MISVLRRQDGGGVQHAARAAGRDVGLLWRRERSQCAWRLVANLTQAAKLRPLNSLQGFRIAHVQVKRGEQTRNLSCPKNHRLWLLRAVPLQAAKQGADTS